MTPKMQRIGILVIAFVMIVGTLGSFAVFILADKNQKTAEERIAQEQQEQLAQEQKETDELSSTYYPKFKEFESRPAAFEADAVGDTVTSVDLQEGDGEVINDDSSYRAYYLGWQPDGNVFDGSIEGEKLNPPIPVSPGGLIPGWFDGVEGMKIGGVREITIPASLAYGETGNERAGIPPNTPLKFLIMAIPASE